MSSDQQLYDTLGELLADDAIPLEDLRTNCDIREYWWNQMLDRFIENGWLVVCDGEVMMGPSPSEKPA